MLSIIASSGWRSVVRISRSGGDGNVIELGHTREHDLSRSVCDRPTIVKRAADRRDGNVKIHRQIAQCDAWLWSRCFRIAFHGGSIVQQTFIGAT